MSSYRSRKGWRGSLHALRGTRPYIARICNQPEASERGSEGLGDLRLTSSRSACRKRRILRERTRRLRHAAKHRASSGCSAGMAIRNRASASKRASERRACRPTGWSARRVWAETTPTHMSDPLKASIDTRKKGRRLAIVPMFWERATIQRAQVDWRRQTD